MRLLFAGTPETALPVAEAVGGVHDVVAVLTRPPAAQGRSSRLVASPVARWAEARRVEVLDPVSPRDPALAERIRRLAPECCVVVAYGGLITRKLLALPRHGWVNLHYSLLPAYRGAAPVQHALLDGRATTGVTTFRLVPALDAGPVFLRREVAVAADETAGDLLDRLSLIGAQAMVETLAMVEAGVSPTEQGADGVSWAPKLDPEQARLDWSRPALELANQARAMSPDPGAWTLLAGQRFRVLRAAPGAPVPDLLAEAAPGRLWATKRKLYCRAGDGWVELVQVQAAGKQPMAGADWARGGWRDGMSLG